MTCWCWGAGELGMAVLRHLVPRTAGAATALTVLVSPGSLQAPTTRREQDLGELSAMGAQLLPFDLANASVDELAGLFGRFRTVVNCTGFVAGPGTQRKVTEAVLRAGVPRYFPWQFGVNYDIVGKGSGQPVFDEQYQVRTMLRAQAHTEWVIVSTGMFTSFLFEPAFGLVDFDAGVVRGLGSWDTRVTVTTPEDIGRLTTAILLEAPRIANEVVFVASDTLSYGELADVVDDVIGRPFRRDLLTMDRLSAELALHPEDVMARYRIAFARGEGMWWAKDMTYNAARGMSTTDTRTWLRGSRFA
jgi:uncharacterized protein YbjT (DUF2867 family)